MRFPTLFAAMLVSGCMTAASAAPPLEGVWGALGAVLTLNADGGMIEESCSQLALGPIRPDGEGRFSASGRYGAWQDGPQQADEPGDAGRPVTLAGRIEGDRMQLRISGAEMEPRELVLQRGLRAKVIRCL